MALTKLVPLQIDENTVLYIEAEEETETLPYEIETGSEEVVRNNAKGKPTFYSEAANLNATQTMRMLQSTIRAYAAYTLNAFKNFGAANVNEVTLEFGVSLSANGGIPYIASGKADSNLKITVKCSYPQTEAIAKN